jgi:Fe-S-cluster containining protein
MATETANLVEAVAAILAEADADIAARRPVCLASGRCCRFEEYGHRLYVTAAEVVFFESRVENTKQETQDTKQVGVVSLPQFFSVESPRGCPFQVEGLCTAREARPLGCRLYFCDENAQSWQSEVYEKYHAKLRAVHERFGLPYRYLEWRAALRELM